MSFGRRFWRIARGMGDAVVSTVKPKSHDAREAEREAQAELERLAAARKARAEAEAILSNQPTTASEIDAALPPSAQAPATPAEPISTGAGSLPGMSADPLAGHYAVLGLPAGSTIERVEHAYQRLKEEKNPDRLAADPVAQARARQQDARLDEAYLALRQALVRERRL